MPAAALRVGPAERRLGTRAGVLRLGGVEPTVTDANVLRQDRRTQFLGGEMPLDVGLAEQALDGVASRLELDIGDAAMAILRIANSIMAIGDPGGHRRAGPRPARLHALVCYGGAAPCTPWTSRRRLRSREW